MTQEQPKRLIVDRTVEIGEVDNWTTLAELKQMIDDAAAQYPLESEVYLRRWEDSVDFELSLKREETDDELEFRLASERQAVEREEARAREQYERLKARFENGQTQHS